MAQNDWYPNAQTVRGYPKTWDIEQFLEDLDIVLLAETPLNYSLYTLARAKGIKTAVVHNYEFFDHFIHPEYDLPDLFISPSMWNYDVIDRFASERGVKHVYLHHPVDRKVFQFRLRSNKKFIHIAGRPAAHDRNGTWNFLEALSDGTVITQSPELAHHIGMRYRHSTIYSTISDPSFMYRLGDILVLPRKYGGNCLPLNEALSSGMPVIMPDISPNNYLLPKEWLVPASITGSFEPRTKVAIYSVDINALRDKLQWFKECDMEVASKLADQIADSISWETLRPKYLEVLEQLCES